MQVVYGVTPSKVNIRTGKLGVFHLRKEGVWFEMFYFVVERKAGVWGRQNKGNRHCKCRKILQWQVKKNTAK